MRDRCTVAFDTDAYDLHGALVAVVDKAASEGVPIGSFTDGSPRRLEYLKIDEESYRNKDKQAKLYELVTTDDFFLACYKRLLENIVVPDLMRRLAELPGGAAFKAAEDGEGTGTMFYCQFPPTLRLQPGPGTRYGRPHSDDEYGHQVGEINFWLPLTPISLTRTALWVESEPGLGDYKELSLPPGEMAAFHGTLCRHHAEANPSTFTRASLDFRIGVGRYFDPAWVLRGTKADHGRIPIKAPALSAPKPSLALHTLVPAAVQQPTTPGSIRASTDLSIAAAAWRVRKVLELDADPGCTLYPCEDPPASADHAVGSLSWWDRLVSKLPVTEELARTGCFQLRLPPSLRDLNRDAFRLARVFLDKDEGDKQRFAIKEGSLNGYHGLGGLSKYNKDRSGFIFEDETVLDLLDHGSGRESFVATVHKWRQAQHDLAAALLRRLAEQLGAPPAYFEAQLRFMGKGQLHVKRFRGAGDRKAAQEFASDLAEGPIVRLLPHTDPSLLSIVLHDFDDSNGLQEGALGLEVWHTGRGCYKPLPAAGWSVATVMAGDVLARICASAVAPKHRVVASCQHEVKGSSRLRAACQSRSKLCSFFITVATVRS
jgi:isopenicillin N synthase-like dioxygenase